jgi:hypothetical protein
MFEIARLVGTPPGKIILQTRVGRNVENSQPCEPDATLKAKYDLLRRNRLWENRKPACGFYNCFGLVWANRRTAIYDEDAISQILMEDGYRRLQTDEQPSIGDIVLYRHLSGDIYDTLHAAVVMELRQIGETKIPWILSKWNDVSGEDIHAILDFPQHFQGCLIEYWTDRP